MALRSRANASQNAAASHSHPAVEACVVPIHGAARSALLKALIIRQRSPVSWLPGCPARAPCPRTVRRPGKQRGSRWRSVPAWRSPAPAGRPSAGGSDVGQVGFDQAEALALYVACCLHTVGAFRPAGRHRTPCPDLPPACRASSRPPPPTHTHPPTHRPTHHPTAIRSSSRFASPA